LNLYLKSETGSHETHFSAIAAEAKKQTRISETDENPGRTRHSRASAGQRAPAVKRLTAGGRLPGAIMSETFGRDRRLTRRAEFLEVYKRGRAFPDRLFVAHVLEREPDRPGRLGLTASRRVGRAHERNRYKRWAREVFRRAPLRGGFDLVVTFRRPIATADFHQFRSAMMRVLKKAHLYEP
jgi:ribonuclease P protein component